MSDDIVLALGFPEYLVQHLREFDSSSSLGFRIQPPEHWRSSPIAARDIIALWECGTSLTYFDKTTSTFRKCHLENIDEYVFEYRNPHSVLADIFVELFEDETPDDELLHLAIQLEFPDGVRVLKETSGLSSSLYESWAAEFRRKHEA